MTFRVLITSALAAGLLATACDNKGGGKAEPNKPSTATNTAAATSGEGIPMRVPADKVIASWDGGKLTYGDLHAKKNATFKKLYNGYLRDLYSTEQQELDGLVVEQLVEKAAGGTGKTKEQYLQELAGAPQVSDQEISEFYEKNVKSSGQPLEVFKDRIRQYLTQQKQQTAMRAAIDKLKADAKVQLDLPAPSSALAQFDLNGRPMKGKPDAKVTVVEFSDFQCPYCSRAVPGVEALLQAYPNDVKVYFLHFPLSFHPNAMPAAIASACANQQGKFWPFHDKLFANQANLNPDLYTSTAKELQLDEAKFKACLDDPATKQMVTHDMEQGEAAGVQGTPSFYINGVQYAQGVPTPDALKSYVDSAPKK